MRHDTRVVDECVLCLVFEMVRVNLSSFGTRDTNDDEEQGATVIRSDLTQSVEVQSLFFGYSSVE